MIFRFLVLTAIMVVIDMYVWSGVKVLLRNLPWLNYRSGAILFWVFNISSYLLILTATVYDYHLWNKAFRTYSFAFVLIFYFSKIFFVLFLFIDDLWRLAQFIYTKFSGSNSTQEGITISRSEFIMKAGALVAAVPFGSMIYGMINGAYNYHVRKLVVKHKSIPASFNGFKMLQISDLHTGSFTFQHKIDRAVEMIMNEQADVIFFTGDLVNEQSGEAEPYIKLFSKIKAPHGVYSIFGNHDYGDYHQWPSQQAKYENLERLKQIHSEMGWNLMLDTHTYIDNGKDKLGLIGIQNWSAKAQFPKYGDLHKATQNLDTNGFNILLSHDPSHWQAEVLKTFPYVHLMLSGHTHGMQFGVEIPGFKWSPVQYVYHEWAGLYTRSNQHLYVNRGLGFLGYPGRVGILPEITVIELQSA